MAAPVAPTPQIPERFRPSKSVLLVDKLMTYVIMAGGVLVVTAVLGIFVFIFLQILPLFKGAAVKELTTHPLSANDYRIMGVDEWSELPFLVEADGNILFYDLSGGRAPFEADLGLPDGVEVTAIDYRAEIQTLIYGLSDGRFSLVTLNYRKDHSQGGMVVQGAKAGTPYDFGVAGGRIRAIGYGDSGKDKVAAAILDVDGVPQVRAVTLTQRGGLMGGGSVSVGKQFDLTQYAPTEPTGLLVDRVAEGVLLATADGKVHYLFRRGDNFEERQVFEPFGDQPDKTVSSMNYILGDVSVVFTNPKGENRVFSLFAKPGETMRTFGQIKQFPDLPAGATFFAASLRNKSFLLGAGDFASLRYSTTEAIRWEQTLGYQIKLAALGGKGDRILFLDNSNSLHVLELKDPHPEASWQAFFGKIWYEGAPEPKFEWQSTGGSDEFEPKLSMVPLLIGTMKGTIYAMLFSLPIALLAAFYTSQFLDPNVKRFVKPTMEIMASLPSVVLGFLAALWLAPLIETKVPSVFLTIIALPVSAILFGWIWSEMPKAIRNSVAPGMEFIAFLPVMALACWIAWSLGPWVESWAFVVQQSDGTKIADFRRWWPQVTNTPFEQRNSLVVGFMMGFAVIPIIFTVSEDALSNVPGALRSGSLALGASRWQTAMRVVLPTASPGIFSAVMIGLGRAVGETMIVVMATGNTPIMDLNIFSGMRTLSANIAVELPEAPHHGTLFRALFLGAMLLFLMTFVVNTLAEVMRQHLREKYKTI